jgi:hypothetical protein
MVCNVACRVGNVKHDVERVEGDKRPRNDGRDEGE